MIDGVAPACRRVQAREPALQRRVMRCTSRSPPALHTQASLWRPLRCCFSRRIFNPKCDSIAGDAFQQFPCKPTPMRRPNLHLAACIAVCNFPGRSSIADQESQVRLGPGVSAESRQQGARSECSLQYCVLPPVPVPIFFQCCKAAVVQRSGLSSWLLLFL